MRKHGLLICLLAAWVGCGKTPPATPPSPTPTAAPAEATAEPPGSSPEQNAAKPAPPTDEAQIAAVLGELTQAVRRYAVEQRRAPKTLDELVAQGYLDRVPEAPAGKRFAIGNKLEVYLADK
jgi:hypothetical protein